MGQFKAIKCHVPIDPHVKCIYGFIRSKLIKSHLPCQQKRDKTRKSDQLVTTDNYIKLCYGTESGNNELYSYPTVWYYLVTDHCRH